MSENVPALHTPLNFSGRVLYCPNAAMPLDFWSTYSDPKIWEGSWPLSLPALKFSDALAISHSFPAAKKRAGSSNSQSLLQPSIHLQAKKEEGVEATQEVVQLRIEVGVLQEEQDKRRQLEMQVRKAGVLLVNGHRAKSGCQLGVEDHGRMA